MVGGPISTPFLNSADAAAAGFRAALALRLALRAERDAAPAAYARRFPTQVHQRHLTRLVEQSLGRAHNLAVAVHMEPLMRLSHPARFAHT
jgi:hypothetical protein